MPNVSRNEHLTLKAPCFPLQIGKKYIYINCQYWISARMWEKWSLMQCQWIKWFIHSENNLTISIKCAYIFSQNITKGSKPGFSLTVVWFPILWYYGKQCISLKKWGGHRDVCRDRHIHMYTPLLWNTSPGYMTWYRKLPHNL